MGAGAAGLATAIFSRRVNPAVPVLLLEGARRPGAKILVSGGSRCNVTNRRVSEHDFNGGRRTIIRRVLRALPVGETVAFFHDIGVPLHEEAGGKLFPDSNRARDVLEALLRAAGHAGVRLLSDCRVESVTQQSDGFELATTQGPVAAKRVVLATGGQSLPKSGSDGAGYSFARHLGHTIVETTPALVPLLLADRFGHRELSGIAHDAELELWIGDSRHTRLRGALLWTHFGISGPLTLDMSRHWLRAALEGQQPRLTLNLRPACQFDAAEREWLELARDRPRAGVHTVLASLVPSAIAAWVLRRGTIEPDRVASQLSRDERRALVRALTATELPVIGSRGYTYAEATAGGVALEEIDPATMASRICPGLLLVGEVLDVDGRIGGFNFQWAWASGFVAGRGIGRE